MRTHTTHTTHQARTNTATVAHSKTDDGDRSTPLRARSSRSTGAGLDLSALPVQGATTTMQAKMRIGSPQDPLEHEADKVAKAVTSAQPVGPSQDASRKYVIPDISNANVRMRTSDGPAHYPAPDATSQIQELVSRSGCTMASPDRMFFESRFGRDFSHVRLHHSGPAAASAEQLGARAYTVGPHIVFGQNQYAPRSAAGRELIAHELTHVVQQSGNRNNLSGSNVPLLSASQELIQADFAIEPPNPAAVASNLTPEEVQEAIDYNNKRRFRPIEIEQIRDVIGIPPQPVAINQDFVEAVVRFQAMNDLSQDGKIGAITAARLSNEFRAEGQFLGRAEGRELRHESRRLDRRSFNIAVTQAPIELTNTGSAEYRVQWSVPDPQANGWIIQHIIWDVDKEDAAGTSQPANNSDGLEFWEAWEVRGGSVFVGSSATAHNADTFRSIDEGAGTRGEVRITGRVTYMPGFDLREPPWGHAVPEAGALPTITGSPDGWADGFARRHNLTVSWDDTVAPATHNARSVP